MPGLEAIDVVATEALLDSGYHQRLHERTLPGIEDVRGDGDSGAADPVLAVPPGEGPAFICRDREEELAEFARAVKSSPRARPLGRMAVVFQRPLPYLYLARQVFADAQIPYQALDALPLAAEPFAAAFDIIFSAIAADFTRGALLELLRCPHLEFVAAVPDPLDAGRCARASTGISSTRNISATRLVWRRWPRVTGSSVGARSKETSLPRWPPRRPRPPHSGPPLTRPRRRPQIAGPIGFLTERERLPVATDPWRGRHMRARAAVFRAADAGRGARGARPAPLSIVELSGAVRRWIEGQTFSPRLGTAGVMLLDAQRGRLRGRRRNPPRGADGVDWPERSAGSIFYPQSLSRSSAGPESWIVFRPRARGFRICSGCRAGAFRSRPSRWKTTRLCRPRPLSKKSRHAGLQRERLIGAPGRGTAACVRPRSAGDRPDRRRVLNREAAEWLSLRASRRFDDRGFAAGFGSPRHRLTRSAASSAISNVRSSISRGTCSSCRRSGTSRPG